MHRTANCAQSFEECRYFDRDQLKLLRKESDLAAWDAFFRRKIQGKEKARPYDLVSQNGTYTTSAFA